MRDVSFLEWFLLGMPWEWAVLTAAIGGAFLLWTAISSLAMRRRHEQRGQRQQRDRGAQGVPEDGPDEA
jgi:membrane protein implicated in regulation of membrane protease activity